MAGSRSASRRWRWRCPPPTRRRRPTGSRSRSSRWAPVSTSCVTACSRWTATSPRARCASRSAPAARGMTQLAGFLDVLLRGFGTVGLAAAVGGLVYLRLVLRPPPGAAGLVAAARGRALGLGILLMGNAAWLAHAVSRLHDRGPLMVGTVLHQLGAVVWVGGLLHLVGFALLWRRAGGPAAEPLGVRVLARFSAVAIAALVLVLGPGIYLSISYVRGWGGGGWGGGGWGGLVGTGYGVMVLTKVALLGCALVLGGLNFLILRWGEPGAGAVAGRVPAFIEAEVGLGLTLLLAAASLTSRPPSVDVVADRATPAEVAARFRPAMPRLSSPPIAQLLAAAAPMEDTLAKRQPEEYAWSEYNHHAAGFFVFTMGLLALLDQTGRARWARHWPLGFLGLAAFLFVRNDPRAWPLRPAGFWESMVLPDVLQHRLVVLLVVALAVFEWMVRSGRLTRPGGRLVFPVLCASGGALLLTHSHAMFNLKTEFLTEVSHAPMGLLGVVMAWGRWLEVRLPAADRRIPGWIWAACMTAIGLILLVYRET